MDARGEPLPWITYPAIDFLSQFDFSDASVFEWGSGHSTLWWVKRCRRITSVESYPTWVAKIRSLVPEEVDLVITEHNAEAEVAALVEHASTHHDVIVIDNHGPYRHRCAEAAVTRLSDGGMIILDNSDQCPRACEVLRVEGFTQIDFTGFVPGSGYATCTSVFFKHTLKFKARGAQPHPSPAQPNPPWENC